jgi:5-methylcytosine-specific restriction endonuclease McrA
VDQLNRLPCKICRKVNCHCRKKPIKTIRKITQKKRAKNEVLKTLQETDGKIYLAVWNERPHNCENCECIIYNLRSLNFHHLAEKRNYPELRHIKENIALLCADCHSQVEINPAKTPKLNLRRRQIIEKYT